MKHTNKILQGDALTVLKTLPDEFVDCVVTSPPYWGLRSYGTSPQIWGGDNSCAHDFSISSKAGDIRFRPGANTTVTNNIKPEIYAGNGESCFCAKCGAWRGELGLEPDFREYVHHLCDIFDEIRRVLKPEGTCFINLGDVYSGADAGSRWNTGQHIPGDGGKNKLFQLAEESVPQNFDKTLPDKCMCQIPARVAIEMCDRGWILRNRLIWHKPNVMPSSAKDRFTVDYEDVLFFAKSRKYYFETQYEPVKEESIARANRAWYGAKHDGRYAGRQRKERGEDIDRWAPAVGRNKRSVWTIPTHPFSGAHFATYPEALIETPIKAGCPPGGRVLDPFFGAGTTGVVALKLGRTFLGIELNPEYIGIADRRLAPFLQQRKLPF